MWTDDLGREVPVSDVPQRIVSLCPSQTELLFDLGVGEQVVGVTKFCVHPAQHVKSRVKVGGTKEVHYDRIEKLNPDLILAQREENTREMVERLSRDFPVYVTDVVDVASALAMIERVAAVVGQAAAGHQMAREVREGLAELTPLPRIRVVYLIWRDPWMAAGTGTFIDSVLQACGFENALSTPRYPVLDEQELKTLAPDVLLLSSEPFPFREKHRDELRQILPATPSTHVDGEVFSWYGSRMRRIPDYARELRRFFGGDPGSP